MLIEYYVIVIVVYIGVVHRLQVSWHNLKCYEIYKVLLHLAFGQGCSTEGRQ